MATGICPKCGNVQEAPFTCEGTVSNSRTHEPIEVAEDAPAPVGPPEEAPTAGEVSDTGTGNAEGGANV